MYGQNKYGVLPYGSESSGNQVDDYYVDLIPLLPEFITEKREMHELLVAQGYQVGQLEHDLLEVIDQCFIVTATWGLTRWEQIFGVPTNLSLSYEQRREILMAKLRGQGTTTIQMIKDTAAAFSGGEVDVIEDNPHYRFIVRFIGIKGIPQNMQGFISMLEEIKPAHLAYVFEYRYTVWGEMEDYNWDLEHLSWEDTTTLKEA